MKEVKLPQTGPFIWSSGRVFHPQDAKPSISRKDEERVWTEFALYSEALSPKYWARWRQELKQ